ncbi:MAG: YraN family protein [Prevotella sp.]|nr:YraN family protein [Candidatus Prevotella equi]
MAWHNDLGKWGEEQAAKYLEEKGWYIRHRDWRDKHRDLDIVCIDANMTTLLIVEVKTRSSDYFKDPVESITLEKQNNILKASTAYRRFYNLWNLDLRIDTICIVGTPGKMVRLDHQENAIDTYANYLYKEQQRKRAKYKKRPGCW